ncbi:MAG: DoxX family protein [Ilumatobacteraceae bacterium]
MSLPEFIARPLLAGMFVYGGLDSVRNGGAKADAAERVVEPVIERTGLDSEQLVRINGAVQVVAGTALALGILPRPAAAALAVTLVPTTLAGHRFWEEDDAKARAGQTIHFLKNAAMLGGLLLAATSTGGRPSLPWRARHAFRR